MATSLARQFFEKALAGGSAFLKILVTEEATETEWLDFKGADHLNNDSIKVNWSKFICGFANNEGGVIVWGIDARKHKVTEIDAAGALAMSPDPKWLSSRLKELHPESTDPPLVGVESVAVCDVGDSGPGFVVSFVPESDVKPHRAELVEGKPYFLRVGDRFHNPSPSLLRNLFYPRSSVKLHIGVEPTWQAIDMSQRPSGARVPPMMEISYRVTIHNAGAVSAKDVFIVANSPQCDKIETPYKVSKTEAESGIGIDFGRPIHPLSNALVGVFRVQVPPSTRVSLGDSMLIPRLTPFSAEFRVFAADMTPLRVRAEITDWEQDHQTKKWAMPVVESLS